MVEVLNLDETIPWNFVLVVAVLFLVLYGGTKISALLLLVVLMVILFFDFSEPQLGCENKTTESVCNFYKSNQTCPGLTDLFLNDPEWARYRYAKQKGLPADPTKLLNGYNVSYFPECTQEVDNIRNEINGYDGKSNFPETQTSFRTFFQPIVFLVLGSVGTLFSVAVIGMRLRK